MTMVHSIMCSRTASLITRAYRVQNANLTLYKQHKSTRDGTDVKKSNILFKLKKI